MKENLKTKEVTENLYNRTKPQTIPLEITKGNKTYKVKHNVNPISDERFFALESELEKAAQKTHTVSLSLSLKAALWREIAESVEGYAPHDDWREKMHQTDAVSVVNAVLSAQVVVEETEDSTDALDFEIITPIKLKVLQSGVLMETILYFREETQSELDSYLSILQNAPDRNAIASAVKISKSEKLANLAHGLLQKSEGYDSEVPAWHLAAAAHHHFASQLLRLKK